MEVGGDSSGFMHSSVVLEPRSFHRLTHDSPVIGTTSAHSRNNRYFEGQGSTSGKHSYSITFQEVLQQYANVGSGLDRCTEDLDRNENIGRAEKLLRSVGNIRTSSARQLGFDSQETSNNGIVPHAKEKSIYTADYKYENGISTPPHSVVKFSPNQVGISNELYAKEPISDNEEENSSTILLNGKAKKKKRTKSSPRHKKSKGRLRQGRISIPSTHVPYNSDIQLTSKPWTVKAGQSKNAHSNITGVRFYSDRVSPSQVTHKENHSSNQRLMSDGSRGTNSNVTTQHIDTRTHIPDTNLAANCTTVTLHALETRENRVNYNRQHSAKSEGSVLYDENKHLPPTVNGVFLDYSLSKPHNLVPVTTIANTMGTSCSSDSKVIQNTETTLSAIYGRPQSSYQKQVEASRIRKVFLSEKQSGSIKESGLEIPCAPPVTPMPDMLKKYEYIPSMNDIRAQRAVKLKLQTMENHTRQRSEKKKEEYAKVEKQQQKDKERSIKAQQRMEIYALNKEMTELENRRFQEFCKLNGINS
ncbi:hypothetical protein ACJMK2_007939 [Sinanodonta woodiana]|uniref:Small vasohibin-binding protein n=1 Tax=Sinanodonta woodiana TaxID=1069815 RepID=A0ABD3VN09_SINWO